MDLKDLANFLSTVGLPSGILIYLIWRFDKFLTFLCDKLTIYNKEFSDMTYAINGVVQELREIKKIVTREGKK